MSEGAVSASGRCRVAACGHAEHIGWCCRRRRAGRPRLPSGAGARATIASQAAERFYRALPGSAASSVRTRIAVADGGAAEWLPQETILFDRCAVRRHLRVELADGCVVPRRGEPGVRPRRDGRGGGTCIAARCHRGASRRPLAAARCDPAGGRGGGDVAADRDRRMVRVRWRRLVHVAPDAEAALDSVRCGVTEMRCQRLGRHADRAYARRRRCVAACRGDRRVGGVARRAAVAARMAVLRGNG